MALTDAARRPACESQPNPGQGGDVGAGQQRELIGVPNLIVGFKVKNTDLAKEQLIKLEMLVNIALGAAGLDEQTKSHFKRTKVGDYEYLVADVDGSMIPWDQVPLEKIKELEAQPGDAQKIIDRLKQSKLVVALGVRGNYLLCSIGPSLECLEKLGQGDAAHGPRRAEAAGKVRR